MFKKVVIVTGDRAWAHGKVIEKALNDYQPDLVISGGARGADTCARAACDSLFIPFLEAPALWGGTVRGLPGLRKSAGPIRNRLMARVALQLVGGIKEHILVMAFHPDLSQSRGTRDMVYSVALHQGLAVLHYRDTVTATAMLGEFKKQS